ncbi:thermonuclease family protein [Neisseria sp. Ec49-e6-T10]|uniref:thermonuclease family protein n=1 Tax=Neisseria sp. Ec49-e6-T10 TaxID=3140744 RepID=UPI003EBB3F7A
MKKLFLLSLLFLSFTQAKSEAIKCKITEIIDGNTFICTNKENKQTKVKFDDIYSPKLNQHFGQEAYEFLQNSLNKDVRILVRNIIKQNGEEYISGIILEPTQAEKIPPSDDCCFTNLSESMVHLGYSWCAPQIEDEDYTYCLHAQKKAKQAKLGLWADTHLIPPWE